MGFIRKSILLSGSQILCVGLGLITGILYARVMGPKQVGQYQLWNSVKVEITTIFALGIGNANIYFLNNRRVPLERIVTNSLKFALTEGALLTVVFSALLISCPWFFGQAHPAVAILYGLSTGMLLAVLLLQQILVAQLSARRIASVSVLRVAFPLLGGAGLALAGLLEINGALAVMALGLPVTLGVLLYYLYPHVQWKIPFDWSLFLEMVVYGLKLAGANILYLVSMDMSVLMLRWLKPNDFEPIGLYTRATAVAALAILVPRLMGPLLYAKWSSLSGEALRRQGEMALRLGLSYGFLAVAQILLAGKYIIWLLYGYDFIEAQDALVVLAPAMILNVVFNVCSNMLAADGRAMSTTWILAGTLVCQAVATWLLVPAWGIRGAATGMLCGTVFSATTSLWMCHCLYGIRLRYSVITTRQDVGQIWRSLRRPKP